MLTNAHVVEGCTTISVMPDGGEPLPARLIASDKANDLALLKVDHQPAKVAAIRIGIRLGELVSVFGFPLSSVLASTGNFTHGNVTALAGLGDDTRHIQISAPVQPGNSGGPLLDHQGNLVGVVTYKLNALKTAAASGDMPQNVNFALKASVAASFLESNRIRFENGLRRQSSDQQTSRTMPRRSVPISPANDGRLSGPPAPVGLLGRRPFFNRGVEVNSWYAITAGVMVLSALKPQPGRTPYAESRAERSCATPLS